MEVSLKGKPEHYIKFIKAVRYVADLPLKDAKRLVDTLKHGGSITISCSADKIQDLREVGEGVQFVGLPQVLSKIRDMARVDGIEEVLKIPGVKDALFRHYRKRILF